VSKATLRHPLCRSRRIRYAARKARTQALNQGRSLISTAPEPIRDELRHLKAGPMLECTSAYRPGAKRDLVSLTKFSLRLLARRAIALEEEVAELDALLSPLVVETAPELLAVMGLGTDTASALLVAAGDNPRAPPQ
jgi:transposase